MDKLEEFIIKLRNQTNRKSLLYDGVNSRRSLWEFLALINEESGEVASGIIRERYSSTKDECIDLAHTAFLMYSALDRKLND